MIPPNVNQYKSFTIQPETSMTNKQQGMNESDFTTVQHNAQANTIYKGHHLVKLTGS